MLSAIFTSIIVLVFNALFVPRVGIPPFALFVAFANLALLGLGASSEVFDLQSASEFPTTFTLPSEDSSSPSDWLPAGIDPGRVAHTVFTSVGDGVWCYGNLPNVLLWIGFWLASPYQAFTYLSGSTVGQLASIFLGLPASTIHSGFGLWTYGTSTQLIGGLLFVPSFTSYFLGLLAAVLNVLLFNAFSIILSTWGLSPLAGAWSNSLTMIIFASFKFMQTNLVPVHIRDMTVSEDHYFQQLMMDKFIADFGALLKDDEQSVRKSSGDLTSMIDAISLKVDHAEHAIAATADRIAHNPNLLNLIWLVMSWGAFSYSDLQAGNNASANEQDLKHEVEKLIPNRLLGMLPSIFRALKSLDTLYGYETTSKAGFESTLMCVVMLSGAMKPTAAGLHQFEILLADVAERFDESHRTEAAFVFVILKRCAEARIEVGLENIFSYIDSSGDGAVDLNELIAVFTRAHPNDEALLSKLEALFEELDEDKSGDITSLELAHSIMKYKYTAGMSVSMWTAVEKMVIQNSMSQRNSTTDPIDTATSYISAALAASHRDEGSDNE
eukprot:scaffold23917_cov59-Phaeocystis_antarctica.AAC.1